MMAQIRQKKVLLRFVDNLISSLGIYVTTCANVRKLPIYPSEGGLLLHKIK